MGKGLQGAVLRAMRVEEHTATVRETTWITDHIIRITFHSETLLNDEGELPSSWVRIWFPDGEGKNKLHQRAYTLLDADPTSGVFSIAFLIHTPMGPASSWAVAAQPGTTLSIQRFGGSGFSRVEDSEVSPSGYLFVGDAASWPAIRSIVDSLPTDTPIQVLMEKFHDDDVTLEFPPHPLLTVTWVPTRSDSRALVDALQGRDFHDWHCWVAAESTATRLVKTHLSLNFGHNRATMHSQAYWIKGRAMGKNVDIDPEPQQQTQQQAPTESAPGTIQPSVLRPARVPLIVSGLVQMLLSISFVVPFILFAELALRLIQGAGVDELSRLGVLALAVLGINTAGTAVLLFVQHMYDAHYSAALRRRLLQKLSNVPLGWFKDRRSNDVKTLVQDNVSALHYLITHAVPDVVGALVTPLVIVVYLFTVDWQLALVLLLPIALYLVITIRQAKADKEKITTVLYWNATLSGDVERFISGQPVSRVFGDDATVNLPSKLQEMNKFLVGWQRATLNSKLHSLELTKPLTIMVVLTTVGTLLVSAGAMPATHLIPFLILGPSFGERLLAISYAANGLREGLNAKNSLDLALTTPELVDAADPDSVDSDGVDKQHGATQGNIKVENLSFSYSSGRQVLNNIDLDIPAGSTTALVGPSGSGKSTFAALLGRLWDPDSGSIVLDGVDLRAIPAEELHRKVAIVLQDVQLIKGSIFDNIALGHPEATLADVREAAQSAYIDEFIMGLPDGYNTMVDRTSLSGGQRQRVAIARALLGDPAVVVLDEATASADPDSEWAVRQGLNALLAGRTKVIVAHRLHTITDADRIVVINQGDVTEQGTHQELVRADGVYGNLVSATQKGPH